jgi:hypothetical protein
MALAKGTNSYATVAEAETYFEDRIDVAAWTAASAPQKAQALVTATNILETLEWVGVAISEVQSLAFPRNGVYFDPRLGIDVSLSPTSVPSRIIIATYELAYHLLNNDGLLDDTGIVKDLSIGSIKLSTILPASKVPNNVKRIIKPLRVNNGANLWWRAN